MPVGESSNVLMKKSRISDIRFVKQKKQSASAFSARQAFRWLVCFHTFGVRSTIDVLDSENQPRSGSVKIHSGSGAPGLTGDV